MCINTHEAVPSPWNRSTALFSALLYRRRRLFFSIHIKAIYFHARSSIIRSRTVAKKKRLSHGRVKRRVMVVIWRFRAHMRRPAWSTGEDFYIRTMMMLDVGQ